MVALPSNITKVSGGDSPTEDGSNMPKPYQ